MTDDLPDIGQVGINWTGERLVATCQFENGARLRCREDEFGFHVYEVFRPGSASPTKSQTVTTTDTEPVQTVSDHLLWQLESYFRYREGDWSSLPEWPDYDETDEARWFEIVAGRASSIDRGER